MVFDAINREVFMANPIDKIVGEVSTYTVDKKQLPHGFRLSEDEKSAYKRFDVEVDGKVKTLTFTLFFRNDKSEKDKIAQIEQFHPKKLERLGTESVFLGVGTTLKSLRMSYTSDGQLKKLDMKRVNGKVKTWTDEYFQKKEVEVKRKRDIGKTDKFNKEFKSYKTIKKILTLQNETKSLPKSSQETEREKKHEELNHEKVQEKEMTERFFQEEYKKQAEKLQKLEQEKAENEKKLKELEEAKKELLEKELQKTEVNNSYRKFYLSQNKLLVPLLRVYNQYPASINILNNFVDPKNIRGISIEELEKELYTAKDNKGNPSILKTLDDKEIEILNVLRNEYLKNLDIFEKSFQKSFPKYSLESFYTFIKEHPKATIDDYKKDKEKSLEGLA